MPRKLIILFLLASFLVVSQSAFAAGMGQSSGPVLVVNTSFLNVRTADGPQFKTVATVAGGTVLPVLGANSNFTWYLVSTPLGPGWVDVSFTLPRGDFSHVPVVKPADTLPLTLPPPSIALPGSVGSASTAPQASVQGTWRATIDVFSVNFRSQPADNGAIITTLYRNGLGTNDYPVIAFAYDSVGVRWVAIVVPNVGAGWLEANKTTLTQVAPAPVTAAVSSAAISASSVSAATNSALAAAARVVVNTGFENIRLGPGSGFDVVATVPGGTVLEVIGVNGNTTWYLVKGDFGQGWLSSQFVLFRGDFSSVPVLHNAF